MALFIIFACFIYLMSMVIIAVLTSIIAKDGDVSLHFCIVLMLTGMIPHVGFVKCLVTTSEEGLVATLMSLFFFGFFQMVVTYFTRNSK
jgi:hypothetical protein